MYGWFPQECGVFIVQGIWNCILTWG